MPDVALMSLSSAFSASDLFRVEAGRRLVEAEQLRPRAHGARDLQPALCAIGQVARRIVGAVDQVGLFQPVLGQLDRFRRGLAIAAEAEQPEHRIARRLHQLVVLRDEQVFEQRHAGEQADVLEGARHLGLGWDLEVGQALEQILPAVAAGQCDHALGRLVEAGDAVEHRRLAGAVRADQRGDLAATRLEGKIADGDKAAELHRQMVDPQDRVGHDRNSAHQPCPSLVKELETALRSRRKAVGSRLPTKPRGFHSMTTTMAVPKRSMR